MKQLVYENTPAIKELEQKVKSALPALTNFAKTFNQLPPDGQFITSGKDLINALNNPSAFYLDCVKSRFPETEHGLPVDKDARLKTLKLPDLAELIKLAQDTKDLHKVVLIDGLYEVKNNTLSINSSVKESMFEPHRLFAYTEQQLEFAKLQTEFYTAFAKFREFNKQSLNNTHGFNIQGMDCCMFEKIITDEGINPELYRQQFRMTSYSPYWNMK